MKIYNIYHIYYIANCPANVFSRLLESQKYETVQFYFAVPTIVETAMDEFPVFLRLFSSRCLILKSTQCKEAEESSIFYVT